MSSFLIKSWRNYCLSPQKAVRDKVRTENNCWHSKLLTFKINSGQQMRHYLQHETTMIVPSNKTDKKAATGGLLLTNLFLAT